MLRDRLDQRVSKVKALLQLCKGALPRENQTGGKQKKAVPMPRVRTLRKQETRIPHTGSEHLNSALNIRATGSVAKLARLHSVGMRLGCPPPLRRKKIGNQLILPRVMAHIFATLDSTLGSPLLGVGVYDFQRLKLK